jgi:hypothetical protein
MDAAGPSVVVVITNPEPTPLVLCTADLAPSLALEATDATGAPVPLGPPPTPPADPGSQTVTIVAGESLSVPYAAGEIFPGGAAPGRYRMRFAAELPEIEGCWSGRITSGWVTIEVP